MVKDLQDMDNIDKMLRAAGVPEAYWAHFKHALHHRLSETGEASVYVPRGSPMDAKLMPAVDSPMLLGPSDASFLAEARRESEEELPTVSTDYIDDVRMLGDTIHVIDMINDKGSSYEKETLAPKLHKLREMMARHMTDRCDDAIADMQRIEHERKDTSSRKEFERWQSDVSEGKTTFGYKDWQNKKETPSEELFMSLENTYDDDLDDDEELLQ